MNSLKYFLIFLLIVLAFLNINFIIFKNKVEMFIEKIPDIERLEYKEHMEQKNKWEIIYTDSINKNSVTDWSSPKGENKISRFKDNMTSSSGGLTDFNDGIIQIDTILSFLLFKKTITYQGYHKKYFECLCYHQYNRWNLLSINSKDKSIDSLKRAIGISENDYEYLRNIINRENINGKKYFPKKDKTNEKDFDCYDIIGGYYPNQILDKQAIEEFKNLYTDFKANKSKYQKLNNSNIIFNQNLYNQNIKELTSSLRKKFDEFWITIDNNFIKSESFTFNGSSQGIGKVEYNIEVEDRIESSKVSNFIEGIMKDFYKTNSLKTGTFPYSNCFGNTNSCSSNNCSQIKVINGNSDVIILIKRGDIVYRHSYIRPFQSFIFNVSNGSYDVYFYYGSGWNPNKVMKNGDCKNLKGGFISNEEVSKDESLFLFDQIMTYTLTTSTSGNFNPKSSNLNEAFLNNN